MTGSTRKRGSTWTAYWFVPTPGGGRHQVSKGGFKTKREAQAHLSGVMSKLLADALRKGMVVRNVAQAASPPRQLRPAERNLTVWSGEELKAFLCSVENERLFGLWRLYAVAGCRRGEALAATWEDVDLDRARWAIRRSLVTIGSAAVFGAPKSGRGRVVALDQATVAILRSHRARQNEERLAWGPAYEDQNLVFCRENGTPLHPNEITHAFGRLVTRAGLRRSDCTTCGTRR